MKKFLKIFLIVILVIFVLICLGKNLGILELSALDEINKDLSNYKGFYFKQLSNHGKQAYVQIDKGVKAKKATISLGITTDENIMDEISKAMNAYINDNPEAFYISSEYSISTANFKIFKYSNLKLNYLFDKREIDNLMINLNSEVDKIANKVEAYTKNIDKEIAVHDILASQVTYYKYKNIDDIPDVKHTAYGALIDRNAVCDGYSKAFKMILDKLGIENIIVTGESEGIAHAWNMVKIENDYYHVDVTSDVLEKNNEKNPVHIHFNLMDKQILKDHTPNKEFEYPKCVSETYNYYLYKDMYINYNEILETKLSKLIKKADKNVLEVRLDERYEKQDLIDALYELDFNSWKSKRITNITYNKVGNVYVFLK